MIRVQQTKWFDSTELLKNTKGNDIIKAEQKGGEKSD